VFEDEDKEKDEKEKGESDLEHFSEIQKHLEEEKRKDHRAFTAWLDVKQDKMFSKCDHITSSVEMAKCYMKKGSELEKMIEKYMKENEIEDEDKDRKEEKESEGDLKEANLAHLTKMQIHI
jgi:hypothetical protein